VDYAIFVGEFLEGIVWVSFVIQISYFYILQCVGGGVVIAVGRIFPGGTGPLDIGGVCIN
jgi:hypothetical protein